MGTLQKDKVANLKELPTAKAGDSLHLKTNNMILVTTQRPNPD